MSVVLPRAPCPWNLVFEVGRYGECNSSIPNECFTCNQDKYSLYILYLYTYFVVFPLTGTTDWTAPEEKQCRNINEVHYQTSVCKLLSILSLCTHKILGRRSDRFIQECLYASLT